MKEFDCLGAMPGVRDRTRCLRNEAGKLDEQKICDLFGLDPKSVAELEHLDLKTTFTIANESERRQAFWDPFEKVARLLVLNPDPVNFRSWLRMENTELANRKPIDLLLEGKGAAPAKLVENILLGIPD